VFTHALFQMTTAVAGAYLTLAVAPARAQGTAGAREYLAGTSWQLVRFEGSDGTVLTPDDRSKYTIAFEAQNISARIDCNRGRGTWTSSGANQVQFGPMAMTRALCPPDSLHDQIVKQWGNIRGYAMKGGHLFLSLMADGGVYEFAPFTTKSGPLAPPVQVRGPATWTCTREGTTFDTLRVTFYATQPGLVVLERGGVTRPAFQVKAASGARYEGENVLFWEAHGQATLNWMGVESTCKPG
jgi:heat shock protein HslJ